MLSGDAARDGRLDRERRRHSGRRGSRSTGDDAAGRATSELDRGLHVAVRRRAHLARGQAARRRVAAPQRTLRGDGRRRRQRRARAEGVAPLDRAGLGHADGEGRRPTSCSSNGDFAAIPAMVAEGRRILRNIQRVTKLFVTKSVFAAFLIVAVGITPADYPLLPRHLTIVGALTVGHPRVLPRARPERRPVAHRRLPAGRRPLRGAGRGRRRARGDDDLPDRRQRLRPRAAAVADGGHLDARRRSASTSFSRSRRRARRGRGSSAILCGEPPGRLRRRPPRSRPAALLRAGDAEPGRVGPDRARGRRSRSASSG